MNALTMDAVKKSAGWLVEDYDAVSRELSLRVGSQVETVDALSRHILDGGGKRLRPLLTCLWARAVGAVDLRRAHLLGAALEMIHMATLIHDDVIDQASTRRGRACASAILGNTAAILCGDVLLAKAMAILGEDGDLEVIRLVSRMVVEMAEGEVKEVEVRGDFDLSLDQHFGVLRAKTASFIGCCCEVGAIVGGGDGAERAAAVEFGMELGMAFQLADDVLDYAGRQETTGKPRASDYREGQATLPLLLLREKSSSKRRELLKAKFGNGVTETEVEQISGWMAASGVFEDALQIADSHVSNAVLALNVLKPSKAKELLEVMARFSIERSS